MIIETRVYSQQIGYDAHDEVVGGNTTIVMYVQPTVVSLVIYVVNLS